MFSKSEKNINKLSKFWGKYAKTYLKIFNKFLKTFENVLNFKKFLKLLTKLINIFDKNLRNVRVILNKLLKYVGKFWHRLY